MGILGLARNIISNEDGVFVCNREGRLGPETLLCRGASLA